MARRVYQNNPSIHVDVGASVEGFVAHIASFRPIIVLDIRPLSNITPNIRFMQADLMSPIDARLLGYCDSLSCLHALEHFGLGRFGEVNNADFLITGKRPSEISLGTVGGLNTFQEAIIILSGDRLLTCSRPHR